MKYSLKQWLCWIISIGLIGFFCFFIFSYIQAKKEQAQLLKLFSFYDQLPEVKVLKKDLVSYYYSGTPRFLNAQDYKEYYYSSIKILDIRDNPFGGEWIRFFFTQKFDAIFDFWVDEIDDSKFQVRFNRKADSSLKQLNILKRNLSFIIRKL